MFADQIMKERAARRRWVADCFKEKKVNESATGKTGKAIRMPEHLREKMRKESNDV